MNIRVCYNTHEFGNLDIHLRTLRDKQEFHDQDGIAEKLGISSATWPLFGVVWPSSLILAHHLLNFNFDNHRVLEVGCGIGLASVLLNHLKVDVTATDYHPEVESFLNQNTSLNQDPKIPFIRTGWADPVTDMGRFTLIVGSDLLYEDEHVGLLSLFVEQHSEARCTIILVDPGRGRQGKFSRKMDSLGFSVTGSKPENVDYLEQPFKGTILRYTR